MYKYYRNNELVENVCPANSALFIYVLTHCVETVQQVDNRYSQLTQQYRGNTSALGARGPGFNSGLRQGFLCLFFCFDVVFLLFIQKHINCHIIWQFSLYLAAMFLKILSPTLQSFYRIGQYQKMREMHVLGYATQSFCHTFCIIDSLLQSGK